MKTLIAAALLLALTTPAFAYGDHVNLTCGKIEVSLWKDNVTVTLPKDAPFTMQRSHSGQISVNGKKCIFLTDKEYLRKECTKGSQYSCDEFNSRSTNEPKICVNSYDEACSWK